MKGVKKWALGGFVGLALLTWAPCHNPSDAAAVIQRDANGEWVRQESTPLRLGLRLTASKSKGQALIGSTHFPDGKPAPTPKLHVSRIWIVNLSEGYLAHRLGRSIQEDLLLDPNLDEVAYFPAADLPLQIRRPPHLFLVLHPEDVEERHWIGWHTLDCDIQLYLGRHPMPIEWYKDEIRSGPEWNARLIEKRRTWGILSRAFRFDDFIEESVTTMKLREVVRSWRDPGLADTPLAWAGPIPEAPGDLDWAQTPGGQLVVAQAPVPLLKEHTWVFPPLADGEPNFQWLQSEMETRGWSITHSHTNRGMSVLVGENGDRTLRAHFPRDTDPKEWVLHHSERAPIAQLFDWLLARETEGASDALINVLIDDLTPDQKAALLAADQERGKRLRATTRSALR